MEGLRSNYHYGAGGEDRGAESVGVSSSRPLPGDDITSAELERSSTGMRTVKLSMLTILSFDAGASSVIFSQKIWHINEPVALAGVAAEQARTERA